MAERKGKYDIEEKVTMPEGIEVEVKGVVVTAKKGELENTKKFDLGNKIHVEKKDSEIIVNVKKSTKRERKMIGTIKAHIKNMIKGLEEPFVYELEICHVHFPMTVTVKEAEKEVEIKNFLGETKPRTAKIIEGVSVKIEGNKITVESHDIEKAGQTAANLEKATSINNKDRRKFQDGLFITSKAGKEI